jgi:hypothetical protein
MSELHVMSALRAKRSDIAKQIQATEEKLTEYRTALANLDAAMNILSPEREDFVSPRKRGKTLYFGKSELSRLVRATLREATEPLSAPRIAADAISAKGLPPSSHAVVTKMVTAVLGALTRRGELVKTGTTRNARWAIKLV